MCKSCLRQKAFRGEYVLEQEAVRQDGFSFFQSPAAFSPDPLIYMSQQNIYSIQIFKYFSYQTFSSKYFIFKMESCLLFTRLFHPNVQIYVLRKDDTRGQLLNSEIHGVFNINTSRHLTSSFILWVFK